MELTFTRRITATPVSIETDSGVEEFELREMKSVERDRYLDSVRSRVKYNAKGEPMGLKSFEGMHADLVSRCLFRKDGSLVDIKELQEWPCSIVTDIFNAAQKLNRLNEDAEAQEKNG